MASRRVRQLVGASLGLVVAAIILAALELSPHRVPAGPRQVAAVPTPSPITAPEVSPSPSPSPPAPPPPVQPVDGMRIQVPELGIDLPVVSGDGINAPLYKAVLDPFLAQPGTGARSMIYAHAQNGMFGPLFHTRVGEHVVLRRPDAPALNYVIAQYYPRWPINDLSVLRRLPREQLVLVTCTTWNLSDPRQVVIANPA